MSKRKPASELNDRNWDEEDEPEEAGTFRLANQDVLKNRTIRKARRTLNTEGSGSGSIFAGFALKTSDSSAPKPSLSTGVTLNFGSNLTFQPKSNGNTQSSSSKTDNGDSTDNPEYLRQLKLLNENILSWIQKHVSENPYCILSPSFKDYEKHLADLEKKYGIQSGGSPEKSRAMAPPAAVPEKPKPFPTFGTESKGPGVGFSFSTEAASKKETTSTADTSNNKGSLWTGTSGFSFGSGLTKNSSVFGGSTESSGVFGSSTATSSTFSFASATAQTKSDSSATPEASASSGATEDEEYVPPKAEVREIKEDGAVYTTRCKLFYQKDGQWADRGVGNLHLKPTDDNRTQLIVRADTNLGNILLNILLSSAIPTKRQGKNNVFLVCVPNPPINPKEPDSSDPVPMLLRVKTGEEADQLLAKLEELKEAA